MQRDFEERNGKKRRHVAGHPRNGQLLNPSLALVLISFKRASAFSWQIDRPLDRKEIRLNQQNGSYRLLESSQAISNLDLVP